MKTLYEKIELKKPGFFQRLLNNEPKENAILEVNNLLATKPVNDITSDEIVAIAKKYDVDFYKEYAEKLKSLYSIYLKNCLEDKSLSDNEIAELKHLKILLDLKETDVKGLHDSVAYELFKNTMNDAIKDMKLDEEEKKTLANLQEQLLIPASTVNKIINDSKKLLAQNVFNTITSDKRLSATEEKEYYALCNSLGIDIKLDEATKGLLAKYKLYWLIENGELPAISTNINLQKNELCYFLINCSWYETRTVTKSIRYGGPAVSFRIMKGVYYRAGNYNLKKQTAEENKLIDRGQLYVTSKRVIFIGSKRSTNIRLNRVLSITPYSHGIEIIKDSGTNPIFVVERNADLLAMIISRVVGDIS